MKARHSPIHSHSTQCVLSASARYQRSSLKPPKDPSVSLFSSHHCPQCLNTYPSLYSRLTMLRHLFSLSHLMCLPNPSVRISCYCLIVMSLHQQSCLNMICTLWVVPFTTRIQAVSILCRTGQYFAEEQFGRGSPQKPANQYKTSQA